MNHCATGAVGVGRAHGIALGTAALHVLVPRRPARTGRGLVLEAVSFRYGPRRHWILDGLDLTVVPGERLGVVGATGAGKATLAALLLRRFDEVTGVLDPRAERRVEEALRRIGAGRAVVLMPHRLATAARADRIAVLADGRIVEDGSHRELLAAGGHYARTWASQAQVAQAA